MAQPYVGEIKMFGGSFAPAGWAFCNGEELPIADNETLFNLIGTTYGGDGQETFALPNLQSRVPVHAGQGPGLQSYIQGETGGVESVTITPQQLPQHSHPMLASSNVATSQDPKDLVLANSQSTIYFNALDNPANMLASAISPIGGSQPHENLHPYLAINFIISLFGVYPSQN